MSEKLGESAGEVTGSGDVRAGDPHVEQAAFEFEWKGVFRSRDPAGELASAGYVRANGFGVAGAEGREVFAEDLATAADLAELSVKRVFRYGLNGSRRAAGWRSFAEARSRSRSVSRKVGRS
ncbi:MULTISPECIES: hypothetical protein [unclassified Streptomyces]|uniref:hypothetical protein n=1 Tax=unclassified Streptomyces TaxID=2593676 RepID=UPI0038273A57